MFLFATKLWGDLETASDNEKTWLKAEMRIKQAIKAVLAVDVSLFVIDGVLYMRVNGGRVEKIGEVRV